MNISVSSRIAVIAVFTALTAVFYFIPFVFIVPLLLASMLFGFGTSLYLSVFMGVIGLLYSYIGGTPLSIAFRTYPWVSIVPRMFIGPAVCFIKMLLKKLTVNSENKFLKNILPYSFAGAAGALVNSFLVIGSFWLFYKDAVLGDSSMVLLLPQLIISAVIEFCLMLIIMPPIYHACQKAVKKTRLHVN